MQFIGELDRSFGNFLTLRGLARMGDLKRASRTDTGFQRDPDNKQKRKMKVFLQGGRYTFYPELILTTLMYKENDATTRRARNKIYKAVLTSNGFNHQFTTFKLISMKLNMKPSAVSSNKINGASHRGILEMNKPIRKEERLIRIDGNHRLSVKVSKKTARLLVPFCIIFIKDFADFDKINRILFTNLNYNRLPLSREQNYKVILDKDDKSKRYLYSDKELRDPTFFGPHFLRARKYLDGMSLNNLHRIKEILQKDDKDVYTKTAIVDFYDILEKRKKVINSNDSSKNQKIKIDRDKDLFEIEKVYEKYPPKRIAKNYQLFVAHLYFLTKGKDYLETFSRWVEDNSIYELKSLDIESLIDLYEQILTAKKRTIFLAMDFRKRANRNHAAIRKAICEINKGGLSTELRLKLLRIDDYNPGRSHFITKEILQQIEDSGYLIADLTFGNKNVYHEIGYRMGLRKDNFLLVHNMEFFGANFKKDIKFNLSGISIVKARDSNDLRKQVKEKLKEHYKIPE